MMTFIRKLRFLRTAYEKNVRMGLKIVRAPLRLTAFLPQGDGVFLQGISGEIG